MEQVAAVLGEKAVNAVQGSEHARIDFLAHLFAICTFWQRTWSSASIRQLIPLKDAEIPSAWHNVPRALEQLVDSDTDRAYDILMGLLLELEGTFDWNHALNERPPVWEIELTPIESGEFGRIGGVVHCWVRPHSALRQLLQERDREGGPFRYTYGPIHQLRQLGMLWDQSSMPRLRPVSWANRVAPALITQSRARLRRSGHFRVALCPLTGPFCTRFALLSGTRPLFAMDPAAPIHAPDMLAGHLDQLLADAREHEIDMVVMPELSMDDHAARVVQGALGEHDFPCAIVPGSFHIDCDQGRRNRAPVLDQDGSLLWNHDKCGAFRIQGKQVRDMAEKSTSGLPGLFSGRMPTDEEGNTNFIEDIQHGCEVQLFDTPLGRIAVLICADALDPSAGYQSLVQAASIDHLLCISMSNQTSPFLRWAEDLRRVGTAVLFVNAGCLLSRLPPDDPECVAAFASLPLRTERLPTRVCWRLCWRYGDSGLHEAKDLATGPWHPWQPDGDAFSFLPEGRGLVINLGAWWRESMPPGKWKESEIRLNQPAGKVEENERT